MENFPPSVRLRAGAVDGPNYRGWSSVLLESLGHCLEVVGSMFSGGRSLSTFGPAASARTPSPARASRYGRDLSIELDSDHQSHAANFLTTGGIDSPEARAPRSTHLERPLGKRLVQKAVEDPIRQRAGQRVSSERRAVRSDRRPDSIAHEEGAHRKASGDGFREAEQVRLETEMLAREEPPGSSEARLHLVDGHEDAALGGELRHLGDEARLGGMDTALALDELQDHAPDRFRQERIEAIDGVVRAERHAGKNRCEHLVVLRLEARAHRAEGAPVEAPLEG